MTPSEIISVWIPNSPGVPAASSRAISSGTAPMPNCSVAPSLDERRGAPRDGDLLGRRRIRAGATIRSWSCSTQASTSETWMRLSPCSGKPADARHARVHLGDGEAVGVARRLEERPVRRAGVRAEAEPAVGVGRGGDREDHARTQPPRDALQAMEVHGQQLDGDTGSPRHALDGTEERAQHPDVRVLQEGVGLDEQSRVEDDVLEVAARRECAEEARRLSAHEAARDGVARTDERCRVRQRESPSLRRHRVASPRTARPRHASRGVA